jgi:hypothetical protein
MTQPADYQLLVTKKRLVEMGLSCVGEEEVQSQDRAEDTGMMFKCGKAKANKQSSNSADKAIRFRQVHYRR